MRADAGDDSYRVVVDEAGLDCRGLTDVQLVRCVDTFADLLEELADGRQVAIMDLAYDVPCWGSITLATLRYASDGIVSRDARVRLATLVDKCRTIEPRDDEIPQPVVVAGVEREPSWGMAHALAQAVAGRAMSCLVLSTGFWPSGWITVVHRHESVDLHVLTDVDELTGFRRGILVRECVPPDAFLHLAGSAFADLIFADALDFRRFKGDYAEILPWLVELLGLLNDHFGDALERHKGDQSRVIAEFAARGFDISPESPQTKKNARAWEQRNVEYQGVLHRCEWHGKRLWNVDRVHFSLPIPEYGGRILVGVFDEHLDT
ncbi:hypothetical protein B4N89_32235 [Embleya scabrispora]|uniref:Uncharacterized protein n=1 Tax=Embleya scabrispora TaxID=159449 RepID=A0A1T3NQ25_9ACTN|nr:hypothetical protein [Embleya scabrispora]OPC78812.1 hypothetical protein B4N89_32235 [Embleya scabrispora]